MIKIILILLALSLGAGTTLLFNGVENIVAKIAIALGFSVSYLLLFIILFFLVAIFATLGIKKGYIAPHYNKKYNKFYTSCVYIVMSLFGVKVIVNGLDKMPKDSNFVMLQNHLSNVDPMLSAWVFKKYPLIFVGKESLFHIPFFGKVISKIGYIRLQRKPCVEDAREIMRGISFLNKNECSLAIYPEGTRNKEYPNPVMLDFKDGAFQIARKSKKPIVITTINGSEKINNKLLFKTHRIQIDVLKVYEPEDYLEKNVEVLESEIKEMMVNSLQNPSNKVEMKHLF